jgi:hypothetical protein
MLFPVIFLFVQAAIYGVTGLFKVKKVDAYEMHKQGKGLKKQASVLHAMLSVPREKGSKPSTVVPELDSASPIVARPSSRDTPSAPAAEPVKSEPATLPDAFKQPPTVSETVDMTLSQNGGEYE